MALKARRERLAADPGLSVADLEKAIGNALSRLGADLNYLVVVPLKNVSWTSAPSSTLPALAAAPDLYEELMTVAPNTALPPRKLQDAVSALLASGQILAAKDKVSEQEYAEQLGDRLRMVFAKVRSCAGDRATEKRTMSKATEKQAAVLRALLARCSYKSLGPQLPVSTSSLATAASRESDTAVLDLDFEALAGQFEDLSSAASAKPSPARTSEKRPPDRVDEDAILAELATQSSVEILDVKPPPKVLKRPAAALKRPASAPAPLQQAAPTTAEEEIPRGWRPSQSFGLIKVTAATAKGYIQAKASVDSKPYLLRNVGVQRGPEQTRLLAALFRKSASEEMLTKEAVVTFRNQLQV
ncbi:unnamed protein product [Effrenium voratum]|nr:unnamed protein product [Effrenium voratum]